MHRDDVTLEMGTIWLPRVEVVRTDGTAVYWEDTRGRVWGVRFLMEGDTLRFMAGCSSLNLTPRIARFSEGARWVPPIPDDESSGTPNIETVPTDKQVYIYSYLFLAFYRGNQINFNLFLIIEMCYENKLNYS